MADDQTLSVVKSEPLPDLRVVKSEPLEQAKPEKSGTNAALALKAASAAMPVVAGWAERLATNPDAWKTGATIGRVVGGLSGGGGAVAAGLASGHPLTILGAPAAAAMGGWVGGKEGWRTVNLAQKLAGKAVPMLEAAGPALSRLSAIQGIGDLAQMAEPNRRDIGFLGIGANSPPIDSKHVPIVNSAIAKALDKLGYADLAKQFRGEVP